LNLKCDILVSQNLLISNGSTCAPLHLGGVSTWWSLGIGSALSGVWWLAFSAFAFARLPERPGPPVPPGINLLSIGWVRTYRLLAHVRKEQPQTAWWGCVQVECSLPMT
jgi:hypothetical protein